MTTRLTLTLLGALQITLDGEPITGFESDKVRALLVYLALEAGRPHRREALAELFWPDQPEGVARNNLRQALANLRKAIHDQGATPPFLHITRAEIQFNPDSAHWVDATAYSALLDACRACEHQRADACPPCIRRLRKAVGLYQGPFLEQFYLGDSAAFEEWALVRRERLQRQTMEALKHLAVYHERRGEYQDACEFTRRQVELEPWYEPAQRRLMRTLALNGRHFAALQQYQTCRRVLADELGIEPAQQTTELFEQIRDGKYEQPEPSRQKSAETGGSIKSQPFRLLALAMLLALFLLCSLGMFAGYLDRNSKHASPPPSTITHDTLAIATDPRPDDAPTATHSAPGPTGIPQTEYQALLTLYDQTGGPGWKHSDGWLSDSTPCAWFGVTCSGGAVIELNLPDNDLSGEIPPETGLLTNLYVLNLEFNQLRGDIPPELGGLSNLEFLSLTGNSQLSGEIPPALGDLTNLEMLLLSSYKGGTQLSGSIPPQLGNLRRLVELELCHSLLSGSIPPALGNLTSLTLLDLSNNPLSGALPSELGNLSNLKYLYVGQGANKLEGPLPLSLMNLKKLEIFFYEGTGFCEPPDAAFQEWLDSILNLQRTGVLCQGENP
jgi:DNA-binding SARP family transcriptional activator